MKGIKGVTVRRINSGQNTSGSIWQDESYDRIIRNQRALNNITRYMFNNPMKAGLCGDPRKYHGWYHYDHCDDVN